MIKGYSSQNTTDEYIIGHSTILQEFKTSLNNEEKLFLCEKYKFENFNNNIVYENCPCGLIICQSCKNYCHKDCPQIDQEVSYNIAEEMDFMVSQYYSSCECSHTELNQINVIDKFTDVNTNLPCFISYFLGDIYSITEIYYHNKKTKSFICDFCYNYCCESKNSYKIFESEIKEFKIETCCCENKFHPCHGFDNIYEYIYSIICKYSDKKQDLHYDEVIKKFADLFREIFSVDNEYTEVILNKFSMFIIIYMNNLIFFEVQEIVLFEYAFSQLMRKNEHFFFKERRNILLTYIVYSYKKNYFDSMKLMSGKLINILSFEQRIKISEKNSSKHINEFVQKIIQIDFVKKIFEILNTFRHYSIKISDDEPEMPLSPYFLKLFFSVYCYEYETMVSFFDVIKDIKYKYNAHKYNHKIKINLDEIFYIFKIHEIDKFIQLQSPLSQKIDIQLIKDEKKFISKIFNFNVSHGDQLNLYINTIFKNTNQIIKNAKDNKEIILNLAKDEFNYFDCFHNKFFITNYKFISIKEKVPELDHLETQNEKMKKKNEHFLDKRERKNENDDPLDLYFKIIFTDLNLEDFANIPEDQQKDFLNFIYYKLKQYFYEKKLLKKLQISLDENQYKKLVSLYKFEVDLNNVIRPIEKKIEKETNEKENTDKIDDEYNRNPNEFIKFKIIDFDLIKFDSSYKKILKSIFKMIFVQEYYKNNQFTKYHFRFNLLLIALVCNTENIDFFINEIKFFDFLFLEKIEEKNIKKSFLIRSLFNTKSAIKDFNFIWKIFYIIFRYFIHNDKKNNSMKIEIMKKFLSQIIQFYFNLEKGILKNEDNKQNQLETRKKFLNDMNYTLIFYFFKMIKRMITKSNFKSILTLDYNVNKYYLLENLDCLFKIVMNHDLKIQEYFESFQLYEKEQNCKDKIEELKNFVTSITIHQNNIPESKNLDLIQDKINDEDNLIKNRILPNSNLIKIDQNHVLIVVLDILGFLKIRSDFNVDLNFLNDLDKNYKEIKKFLISGKNKQKENRYYVFKLEKIFLKYMINFIQVNPYDISDVKYIIDSDFTDKDLIEFSKLKNNRLIKVNIDFKKEPLISKYIFNKLKIKMLELFEAYLSKTIYGNNIDEEIININLKNLILINFGFILRNHLTKYEEGKKMNVHYEDTFFKVIKLFKSFLEKHFSQILKNKILLNHFNTSYIETEGSFAQQELEFDNNNTFYIEVYHSILKIFRDKNFKISKYLNFYGTEDGVYEYLKLFLSFDAKNNNVHTSIVESIFLKRKINSDAKYLKNVEKILKIKDYGQQLSDYFWLNVRNRFMNYNDECINSDLDIKLVDYFTEFLDILEHIDGTEINLNFDIMFSENFLKILNFINNILYYENNLLQGIILQKLNQNNFQILLKNIIKLSNFLISNAEYEINSRFFSINIIYYMLMDFIILLGEGIYNGKYNDFMFLNLKIENKLVDHNLGNELFNDIFNNSTELDDKYSEFLEKLYPIKHTDTHSHLGPILKQFTKDFFIEKIINPGIFKKKNISVDSLKDLQNLCNDFNSLIFPLKSSIRFIFEINYCSDNFMKNDQTFSDLNFNELDYDFLRFDDNKIIVSKLISNKIFNIHKCNSNNIESNELISIRLLEKIDFKKIFSLFQELVYSLYLIWIKISNMSVSERVFLKYIKKYRHNLEFIDDSSSSYGLLDILEFTKENLKILIAKKKKEEQNENENDKQESHNSGLNNKKNDMKNLENVNNEKNMTSSKLDTTTEEDTIYSRNFYYINFIQLKKIINSINCFSFEKYCCTSDRLIIQFLYISRFLKENIELSKCKMKKNKKNIINKCFIEIFDFKWIILENSIKENFSHSIRSEVLKLLIAYLEEGDSEDEEFNEFICKMERDLSTFDILDCIIDCFEKIIPGDKNVEQMKIEEMIYLYIKDESIYNKSEFGLAELYYKLLKINKFNDDGIFNHFVTELNNEEDKQYFEHFCKKTAKSIINNKNEGLNQISEKSLIKNDLKYSKQKYTIYYKFLLFIGKELDIKFEDYRYYFTHRIIYFFQSPKCFWMTNMIKNYLIESSPRTSLGAKLYFFNKNIDKFLFNLNINYAEKITKNDSYLFYQIYTNFNPKYLNVINFIFVVLMNVFLCFYFYSGINIKEGDLNLQMIIYSKYPNSDVNNLISEKYNILFFQTFFFSIIQIFLIFVWGIFRFKIMYWNYYYDENENNYYLIRKNDNKKNFKSLQDHSKIKNIFENQNSLLEIKEDYLTKIRIGSRALLFNSQMISITLCFLLNILYLITNYKLLLVLQILAVINMYSLFEYFLQAIYNKYKEFVSLLIFIYCVEYIFSWVTFLHFQEFMITDYTKRNGDLNQESGNELLCSTAIECFLNYVDLGLRLGGGMGDSAPRISFKFDTAKNYYSKILFDVIFHIVINLILANIFFGVIVDAFNEMRDEKDKKESDQNDKCYMCNRDRYDSSKEGDFEYHRNIEHNIFNYIYFIPYLLKKNPQEYSRAEEQSWINFNLHYLEWFPSDSEHN